MQTQKTTHPTYEIRVEGEIPSRWSEWFEGLAIRQEAGANGPVTVLSGPLPDQPALHGLLAKIRDFNLTLISVTRCE